MKNITTLFVSSKSQNKDTLFSARYNKPHAVKYLEKLSLEAKLAKYPNTPRHYLVSDTFRDDTANGLTKCIITYIRLRGGQAERISTTGRPIDRRQIFTDVTGRTRTIGSIEWIKGNTTNGSADISATIAGRSVKIEVKIGSDRQSMAQIAYQSATEAAGGLYYIARTFAEFMEWYNLKFESHDKRTKN